MPEPTVEVLGVYQLDVTEYLVREQQSILYPDAEGDEFAAAEAETREQLESVVLIEVLVHNRDARLKMGEFAQPRQGVDDPDDWQVAWAEAFLSLDGKCLAVPRWSEAPEVGDLRVAFYIHYWRPDVALMTSYGPVACPKPQSMPERLRQLVPYEPVD